MKTKEIWLEAQWGKKKKKSGEKWSVRKVCNKIYQGKGGGKDVQKHYKCCEVRWRRPKRGNQLNTHDRQGCKH